MGPMPWENKMAKLATFDPIFQLPYNASVSNQWLTVHYDALDQDQDLE